MQKTNPLESHTHRVVFLCQQILFFRRKSQTAGFENYLIGSFDPVLLFIEAIISLLAGVFSTIPAGKHNLTDVPTKRYEIPTGEKFKNFMHDKFEGYTRKKYIFNTEDNLNKT